MFSVFNPEVVKDVELYKSSIPARYGGRLSSVLDISSREGNKKEITGSAGIGLLTSRLNIEGPIVKDKTTFILRPYHPMPTLMGCRRSPTSTATAGPPSDLNLQVTHEINKKNTLAFTGYLSQDHFNLNNDTTYGYGNRNISLKWKHIYNNRLYSTIATGYDRYQYDISSTNNLVNAFKMGFDINQLYFRANFNYFLSSSHTLEFGVSTLHYRLHPGNYTPVG